ncbi:hypothetical protein ACFU8X_08430 [Brevibacillus porteri]|uniref:hypothetical protein n=1 Tax=Brevibacillus porteri TaxID=2126350 RepID=UPI00370CC79B
MNKKVALSVLSTAVVASMAASAFAAPLEGVYVGGNVKKYYHTDTLFDMTKDARAQYKASLKAVGEENIVFVDHKGKGASIQEIFDKGKAKAFEEQLKKEDFADLYQVVKPDGTTSGTEDAKSKVDPAPTGELKVESVSAINAKKLEVKFTEAVKESDAILPGNYNIVGFDIAGANIALQPDEKTVIITLAPGQVIANNTTFVVNVKEIASKADANVKTPLFTKTITFSDTVKPSLVDVKYPQSGVAVVNFTEELQTPATGAVKVFADGKEDGTVQSALTEDGKGIKLTGLAANKEYNVVILGVKDWSNNLINPNPLEIKVKSEVVDNVAPTVSSLVAEGKTSFKVQFSEPVQVVNAADATKKYFTVTGTGVTVADQVLDAKTNTVTVSIATVTGVQSIKISEYKDLAGNMGADFTKNVVFTDVVPAVQKTEVVKDGTNTFAKLTFNTAMTKAVGAADVVGTVVTPDNVVKNVTVLAANYSVEATPNDKVVKIDVTGLEAGKYELTFKTTDINVAQDLKVSFELAATGDTTIPKVDGTPAIDNKVVTVKFDADMGQSALDVNNYTVSGQKVFEKAVFKDNKKTVELTLKEGAIKYDGDYELAVSTSVKGNNNVALKEEFKYTGKFSENVAPTISQAQFSGANKIVLTFSENVVSAADVAGIEVLVDGTKATLGTIAKIDTATSTVEVTSATAEFVSPEKFESAVVVLNVKADNNITDQNKNTLKATSVTVKK